jgi:hypothetical protein
MATGVAYQCLQWGILTDKEYVEIFDKYKSLFKRSNFNIKRKAALMLSAKGHQSFARRFIKKKG